MNITHVQKLSAVSGALAKFHEPRAATIVLEAAEHLRDVENAFTHLKECQANMRRDYRALRIDLDVCKTGREKQGEKYRALCEKNVGLKVKHGQLSRKYDELRSAALLQMMRQRPVFFAEFGMGRQSEFLRTYTK